MGEVIDHLLNCAHLRGGFYVEPQASVAPPIPAMLWVSGKVRCHLRIENQDMVGVGPAVVAGIGIILVADVLGCLLAAVKRDMNVKDTGRLLAGSWRS